MEVYTYSELLPLANTYVATIGMFDGVHLAHQQILRQVVKTAKQQGLQSMLITFDPHPRAVLQPHNKPALLTSLDEKQAYVSECGIDTMVVIPFTEAFSSKGAFEFVEIVLKKTLHVTHLVLGYDHHFGKNREGNLQFLQQHAATFNITVLEIDKQMVNERAINSTDIRKALQQGEPQMAASLLGRPYRIEGKVFKGAQLGRTLGFPTANIALQQSDKLLPLPGVYAVQVAILPDANKRYKGMLNYGFKPTIGGLVLTMEVHLFDFNTDIYDAIVWIYLGKKLRDEVRFPNLEALKKQLDFDKKNAILALETA